MLYLFTAQSLLLVAYKLSITLVYYRLVSSSLRQFNAGFLEGTCSENGLEDADSQSRFQ